MTLDYQLQHTDIPQHTLLDQEVVTSVWPALPTGPYMPAPRELTLSERFRQVALKGLGL